MAHYAPGYSLPIPSQKHREIQSPPLMSSYDPYTYASPPSQYPAHNSHSRTPSISTSSISSSSYAGSAEGEMGAEGEQCADDLVTVLTDRLVSAFDPIPLDRSLALQTQTSGVLNAKTRELMELQALAQSRLARTRTNFLDGMKVAKEVKSDLEWMQKRINNLKSKAEQKYPVEYNMAKDRYPSDYNY